MWIALYLTTAVVVAFLTWHMSHHLQSFEGPSDATRGFCSILAGAIWPVIVVGALEMLAIHLLTRRLRAPIVLAVPVPVMAADFAGRF